MSDQDKNINETRDLLRKKLADQRAADSGWNVPSDTVWTGISEELKAEKNTAKKIDRQYLLLAMIALLVSMLFMQECSNKRAVNKVQGEMQELKKSFDELKKNCEQKDVSKVETPTTGLSSTNIATEEKAISSAAVNRPAGRSFPKKTDEMPPYAKVVSVRTNSSEKQTEARTFSETTAPPLTLNLAAADQPPAPFVFDRKIHHVNVLPQLPFSNLDHPVTLPELDLAIPKVKRSTGAISLIASMYAGVSRTGNQLKGEKPSIISNQKSSWGQRAGLGLEVVFTPKWSLETGLQYATHQLQTDYQLEVPYTQMDEYLHDDGNYDNHYNHSLPSSMGDYPALFVLSRTSDETVEEGETMNLDLSIRQRTRFLSMPIRLRYGFGKGNFQVGVKGGIVANRTLSISSEATELVSHHDAIHQRHTSIGDPTFDNLKKTTFDYSVGLDARYFVTPRMSVSLESTYQQGITPIYQDESVKNYFRSGNLGVGLQYRF